MKTILLALACIVFTGASVIGDDRTTTTTTTTYSTGSGTITEYAPGSPSS